MGVLVPAVALLALIFPSALQQIPTKAINYMLGVVMFGMGLTLNLNDFKIVFSRPKDVVIGCLAQFTVMPLLAWVLARVFHLDESLALGVVLVGCCPGGTASNVITYLAKGDLALSVGMTGVSTLAAPLLTPLLTWALAGKSVDVDVVGMLLSILWVIILPIVVGLIVKSLWPKFTEKATDYLPAFSSVAIAFIVAVIIAANAGYASQPLRACSRVFDWTTVRPCRTKEAGSQHRGGHAKFRSCLVVSHASFCRLSHGHHPRRHLQRVAQYQRCDGRQALHQKE